MSTCFFFFNFFFSVRITGQWKLPNTYNTNFLLSDLDHARIFSIIYNYLHLAGDLIFFPYFIITFFIVIMLEA